MATSLLETAPAHSIDPLSKFAVVPHRSHTPITRSRYTACRAKCIETREILVLLTVQVILPPWTGLQAERTPDDTRRLIRAPVVDNQAFSRPVSLSEDRLNGPPQGPFPV